MKEILLVTYVRFWKNGSGSSSRIAALARHLNNLSLLTVVFVGPIDENDLTLLNHQHPNIQFYCLEQNKQLSMIEYLEKFIVFIDKKFFHAVFLEFIEMVHLLSLFPQETVTILDTHDILSDKISSFIDNGLIYEGMVVDFEEELAIFCKFDYIMLINEFDFEKVRHRIDSSRLLLVPHPVSYPKSAIRKRVKSLLFVASSYEPNLLAIKWFLDEIWPSFQHLDIQLNIVGNVVLLFEQPLPEIKNVNFIGYIEDLEEIYEQTDIVINPIRAGAGLKIKNMEALGHGLPLITTNHGAKGLEKAIMSGCLFVAESEAAFILTLSQLIGDFSLREATGTKAYQFSNIFFSQEVCYLPVTEIVNRL